MISRSLAMNWHCKEDGEKLTMNSAFEGYITRHTDNMQIYNNLSIHTHLWPRKETCTS
jgi:hypothetical protein